MMKTDDEIEKTLKGNIALLSSMSIAIEDGGVHKYDNLALDLITASLEDVVISLNNQTKDK